MNNHTLRAFFQTSGLPLLEARMLVEYGLGLSQTWIFAHDTDSLSESQWQTLQQYAQRRFSGEPMAYIVGKREFMGLDFSVCPAVLIPRPDTEALVENALSHITSKKHCRVLDLGTGSGVIALSIKHYAPHAEVLAVDISQDALVQAQENAQQLGLVVEFRQSHWFEAIEDSERFDVVVSNPPYIAKEDPHLLQGDLRFEPPLALTDFDDGLRHYRQIIQDAPQYLYPEGVLLLEHGWDQAAAVAALLQQAGFHPIQTYRDLSGHDRVTMGIMSPP